MSGSYELIAQAEYILVVALRQNECRLDSAFSVVLKTMEICERFAVLGGREKRHLLRDVLERVVARPDASSDILLPASTLTTLRQLVARPGGVESLAETIVDVTHGRSHVNAVYGPRPGDGAGIVGSDDRAQEDFGPVGCLPLPLPRARRWWRARRP
jgi:hypothetical protein